MKEALDSNPSTSTEKVNVILHLHAFFKRCMELKYIGFSYLKFSGIRHFINLTCIKMIEIEQLFDVLNASKCMEHQQKIIIHPNHGDVAQW